MRVRPVEFSSIAQSPNTSPDGTDDLSINLQPVAYVLSSSASSAADAPTGVNRQRGDSTTASAVSFGFIAIAILVSMFLVIAVFERILRPRRHLGGNLQHPHHDLDMEFSAMSQRPLQWGSSPLPKPSQVSSSMKVLLHDESFQLQSFYGKGVSVVMPGNEIPTFIAHPAPLEGETKAGPEI